MKDKFSKSKKLFKQAMKHLPGGVDSPVRSFSYVGGTPLLFKRGSGSKIYDYDGNSYIDYVLSWGSLILGHAYPEVLGRIRRFLNYGLSFGATHESEIELARLILESTPFAQKIRFVNSGTEAIMSSIRLSRGYTLRDKIVKFEHSYHGHADYLLVKAGSGLATLGIPFSAGVPTSFTKDTLLLPSGNEEALDKLFRKEGEDIACVLIEPVAGNYGVLPVKQSYLRKLRQLCDKYGALLIFDEIITGYRFHFGPSAQVFGIKPDLICYGKIIGGGLPVGAYTGPAKIMDNLAPLGKVYQASTFSGNPIVMESGIATLKALRHRKSQYGRISELASYLNENLTRYSEETGAGLKISQFKGMFSIKFGDKLKFQRFYSGMIDNGVYFAPSELEANFLSFAHTKDDIDKTLNAARKVIKSM